MNFDFFNFYQNNQNHKNSIFDLIFKSKFKWYFRCTD